MELKRLPERDFDLLRPRVAFHFYFHPEMPRDKNLFSCFSPFFVSFIAPSSRAPVPPKRWLKPSGPPTSPFVEQNAMQTNSNFTVTTTVTFNVAKQQHHTSEIEIPPRNVRRKTAAPRVLDRV
jgi:hypothetical protein